jgi:hypothetical protein
MVEHYLSLIKAGRPNVLTIHAEIEGMKKIAFFRTFLEQARKQSVRFTTLRDLANELLENPASIPVCDLIAGTVDGRSGSLAIQRCPEAG